MANVPVEQVPDGRANERGAAHVGEWHGMAWHGMAWRRAKCVRVCVCGVACGYTYTTTTVVRGLVGYN